MHAIHPDRLRVLLAAAAATVIVLLAAAMLQRGLQDTSLSFGNHRPAATESLAPTTSTTPTWATNPLQSPLSNLQP